MQEIENGELQELDLSIYRSLEDNPNLQTLRDVEFHTSHNHIRLRGRVKSFFEKQIAQETIRQLDKTRSIENELTVH